MAAIFSRAGARATLACALVDIDDLHERAALRGMDGEALRAFNTLANDAQNLAWFCSQALDLHAGPTCRGNPGVTVSIESAIGAAIVLLIEALRAALRLVVEAEYAASQVLNEDTEIAGTA